jgi:hypothetical protein
MEKFGPSSSPSRCATCCTFTRTDTTAGFTRSMTSAKDGMAMGCCRERSSACAVLGATKPVWTAPPAMSAATAAAPSHFVRRLVAFDMGYVSSGSPIGSR